MPTPIPCEHDKRGCQQCRRERNLRNMRAYQAKKRKEPGHYKSKHAGTSEKSKNAHAVYMREYSMRPETRARRLAYYQEHKDRLRAASKAGRSTPYGIAADAHTQARLRGTAWAEGQLEKVTKMLEVARACACCKQPFYVRTLRRVIDHDHKTGIVRGLLCTRCNMLLGYAQDSVDRLCEAADYLENHLVSKGV